MRNMLREIFSVGRQQPQLRLDQCGDSRSPTYSPAEIQQQGNLHSQPAGDPGRLSGQSFQPPVLSTDSNISLSQVQVQAKNAFGWGKVSEQFTFRTNAAGERRGEGRGGGIFKFYERSHFYFSETMPVESVRKEYSIFMNNSEMRRSSILVVINCLIATRFLSKWW